MKHYTVIVSIIVFAAAVRAQTPQNLDSSIQALGWTQTPSGLSSTIKVNTYPSLDTIWARTFRAESDTTIWSLNAGRSWSLAPANLGDPWFWTDSFGFVLQPRAFGEGVVFRTIDAGRTWDSVPVPYGNWTAGAYSQRFDTVFHGIPTHAPATVLLINENRLARSTDSGKSWDIKYLPINARAIATSWPNDVVWIVGDSVGGGAEVIAVGSAFDFGSNYWNYYRTNTRSHLASITVLRNIIDDTHEVAVGESDSIIRSTDGGRHWRTVWRGPQNEYLNAVASFDCHVLAVGANGVILSSTDSGASWVRQVSHTPCALISVAMYDSLHAIASGDCGIILVTSNAGASWVRQELVTSVPVITVIPNPATFQIEFKYVLSIPQHVTITILNSSGETVATPLQSMYQTGNENIRVSTRDLASGTYFYRFESEDFSLTGSFTAIH
jgi:photosystem II stability/assembly factor-like uncharacterized protein